MKQIILSLNIIGFIVAGLWLKKSNFDYEPIITMIGLIVTLIATLHSTKEEKVVEGQKKTQSTSIKFQIIYLLIITGLLFFSIYHLNKVSILGIKGNNNDNNKIQIK